MRFYYHCSFSVNVASKTGSRAYFKRKATGSKKQQGLNDQLQKRQIANPEQITYATENVNKAETKMVITATYQNIFQSRLGGMF